MAAFPSTVWTSVPSFRPASPASELEPCLMYRCRGCVLTAENTREGFGTPDVGLLCLASAHRWHLRRLRDHLDIFGCAGSLRGLVRQLSIDQFENEGRRVITDPSPGPAMGIRRCSSVQVRDMRKTCLPGSSDLFSVHAASQQSVSTRSACIASSVISIASALCRNLVRVDCCLPTARR